MKAFECKIITFCKKNNHISDFLFVKNRVKKQSVRKYYSWAVSFFTH